MPDPTYTVAVEFVSGSFTNITSDCLRLSWNKELATYERGLSMGRLNLIIDNYSGNYSPPNSVSAYYPNLLPNKPIRIQATYDSSIHNLWNGYIDSYTIDPQYASRVTNIQASDRMKNLNRQNINFLFRTNYNVGSAFTDILSMAGVNSANRVIDAFTDTLAYMWFEDRQPAGAIDEIVKFGNYKAFIDGQGRVNIRNRYFNAEGTVVASITEFYGLNYTLDEEDIGNIIQVGGDPRKISTSVNTIAWLDQIISIPASGWTSFWLTYVDPVTLETPTPATSITLPVATTDYLTNTQSDGAGANLTASTSVYVAAFATTAVCSIFNGDAANTSYVTLFKMRGYSLQRKPNVKAEIQVASSQSMYGERIYTLDSPLISELSYAQDYAAYLRDTHKDPTDKVSVSVKNQWDYQLRAEVGDMIWIYEPIINLHSAFVVMGVQHEISWENGLEHVVTYDTEIWKNPDVLILDSATLGKLDDGRKLSA